MQANIKRVASCLFALSLGAPAAGSEQPAGPGRQAGKEAHIAFANSGGVRDWVVADASTLLLQDNHGRWYRARLQAPAFHLPYPESLGFATDPSGTLEKFSAVVVWGKRYPIVSLTATEAPAKSGK